MLLVPLSLLFPAVGTAANRTELRVVNQAPAAIDLFDSAPALIEGPACRDWRKEPCERVFAFRPRHIGTPSKSGDRCIDVSAGVRQRQHGNPDDPGAVGLTPHR